MTWAKGLPPMGQPKAPGCLCCQGGSSCPAEHDKGSCPALHEAAWVPLWLSALLLLPLFVLGCLTLIWMFGEYLHVVTRLIR